MSLLKTDTYRRFLTAPQVFRQEIEAILTKSKSRLTVLVDEVQKLPSLLDEVHLLLEEQKGHVQFILTGSSARKLKRGGANLLAGRAITMHLHPLCTLEVDLDLERALTYGTLPGIYTEEQQTEKMLVAYVNTYLREEVQQEALTRNIEGFARFLDVAAQINAEPINYTSISRIAHVNDKTIREYYQILNDTLIGQLIPAWSTSVRKKLALSPKFYFFDCGVLNQLRGELRVQLREHSYRYGKLFENFLVQEIIRYNDYMNAEYRIYHYRTHQGVVIDIILARNAFTPDVAIEIKSASQPLEQDMKALFSLHEEYPHTKLVCLCTTPTAYHLGPIEVLPWKEGLQKIFQSSI